MIDICICTYRRPSVAKALQSVLEQESVALPYRINIIDNDESPSAMISSVQKMDPRVRCFHAPQRNISIARNKAIEVSSGDYVVFLDDDQIAAPFWLNELLCKEAETGADIILGPVTAAYPVEAPAWAKNGDFFSTKPVFSKHGKITTGYTGNVMIRRSIIKTLRFKIDLGRSGGEDTVFFHMLRKQGSEFAFAPNASMIEAVELERLQISWLARRAFRNGQTHARVLLSANQSRAIHLPLVVGKIVYCIGLATITSMSAIHFRKSILRGTLHLGVMCGLLGIREIKNY